MIITRLPLPESDATAGAPAAPAAVVSTLLLHFTPPRRRSREAEAVGDADEEGDDEADAVAARCAHWYSLLSRPRIAGTRFSFLAFAAVSLPRLCITTTITTDDSIHRQPLSHLRFRRSQPSE